jgi:CPA2 family monovalent cation:H+ antiporter-2
VGEFSFVIAGAGLAAGSLSPEGHKLAIAVIAMSLLASPIFFFLARLAHRLFQRHLGLGTPPAASFNAAGADI